jgi:DNA replication protein DnaC
MQIDGERAKLFFQLVSRRYKNGSVIVTSNKSFEEWGDIFGDDTIASAILDRLLHHSYIICINGPSYRIKGKMKGFGMDNNAN